MTLPQEWRSDRLKDRVRFAYGESLAAEDRVVGEVKVFGSNGEVGTHDRAITDAPAIVIGRKGSFGKVTWVSEPCFPIDTTYFVDRKLTFENLRWLYYALLDLQLDTVNFDSAVPGLSREAAYSLTVAYPPRAEQEQIAAYLDASCASLDAVVAAKRRQIETLDALSRSLIARTVTRGLLPDARLRESDVEWLGKVPCHWGGGSLKRFAVRIQTGVTPPTDTPEYYEDGTVPWFAPGSYDGDLELREPRKLINEAARRDGALRMFPAHSVFLVGIGATIGKVGLITMDASCNQQIIGIVSNHKMLPRYLAYQLKIYERVIPGIAIATTLPIFDQVKTGYLPVLAPPHDEQQTICDFLDKQLAEAKRIATTIERQIDTLSAYRKSLINVCVTGQRRVTKVDLNRPQAHG